MHSRENDFYEIEDSIKTSLYNWYDKNHNFPEKLWKRREYIKKRREFIMPIFREYRYAKFEERKKIENKYNIKK